MLHCAALQWCSFLHGAVRKYGKQMSYLLTVILWINPAFELVK
jgi:hypothetical protein